MDWAAHPLALAAVALGPALFQVVAARPLMRLADDPALPERLAAFRNRRRIALSFAFGFLFWFSSAAPWTWPLLIVGTMAAAHPLRRLLYGESWSLAAYLSFFLRLLFAAYGFWILLGLAPVLIRRAGELALPAGLALGAVLQAWNVGFGVVLRRVLGARPLEDPAVVASYRQMADACGLPLSLRLDVVPMRGGSLANAVALPSTFVDSAVVVSETLVDRFDAQELRAVLAHELAHIEDFTPRVLRRLHLWTLALIVVAVTLGVLGRHLESRAATALLVMWPIVVTIMLVMMTQRRQQQETEADVRAVTLSGEAAALSRALVKLHAFNLIPRRWSTDVEQQASHPSLARRLQAIAAAAGTPSPTLDRATPFTATGGATLVTFHAAHVEWQSDVTTHTFQYQGLTELRVSSVTSGGGTLVAVDAEGRSWSATIAASDVARLQGTLDVVDAYVGKSPSARPVVASLGQLAASLVAILAMMSGALAVAAAASVALFKPAPALVAAAGAAGLAHGALRLLWPQLSSSARDWMTPLLVVAAALALSLGWANRGQPMTRRVQHGLVVFGVLTAIAWLLLFADGLDPVRVHARALAWPAAVVLPAAAAAALALAAPARWRWSGLAVMGLATTVAAVAGTNAFVERTVRDPFMAPAGLITVTRDSGAAVAERRLDEQHEVESLWVSPRGEAVAFGAEHGRRTGRVVAGPAEGTLTGFDADDARFLDERRLLLMSHETRGVTLRVVDLAEAGRETWRVSVPVDASALSVARDTGQWTVLGTIGENQFAQASGRVGATGVDLVRHQRERTDPWVAFVGRTNNAMFGVESDWVSASFGWPWLATMTGGEAFRTRANIWRVDATSRRSLPSSLGVTCATTPAPGALVCAAYDGAHSRLFSVSEALTTAPMGKVAGQLRLERRDGSPWIDAWLDGAPVLVHALTPDVRRPARGGGARPFAVSSSAGAVVTASFDDDATVLRVYTRDDGAVAASAPR